MRGIRAIALCLCLSGQAAGAGDFLWTVSVNSPEVLQGGLVQIEVTGSDLAEVKGSLRSREFPFFPSGHGSYASLIGVDLEEKAGIHKIVIRAMNQSGGRSEKIVALRVVEKEFPRENISVPDSFDRIDEATRKRIEREQAELARLWRVTTGRRFWEGGFLSPVAGEVTSPFGFRRIVNGSPRSPHTGVDLKAHLGTEVLAANHGQVVLRDEFFFNGKSIVLDHGGGLYTMYFHLADFRVAKGLQVRKGDLIGWAGMTGRVTGPHLHWGVRLHGARVDPFELLEATGNRQ
ncbi:MAG: M23 family metallopeptidase [Candidatus Binatia bacterium]